MATKPIRSKKTVVDKAAADQPNTLPELSTGAVDNPLPDVAVADAIADDLEQPRLAVNPDDQGNSGDVIDNNDDVIEPIIELVSLHRDEPQHEGGPLDADVHPDEIDNYLAAGWVR